MKAAVVDVDVGALLDPDEDPRKCDTPDPAGVRALAAVVAEQVAAFGGLSGPVGCTFPARLHAGQVVTAVNMDEDWLGENPAAVFEEATGRPFAVINDADAAGVAEVAFGAARDRQGLVAVVTLGTGVGTALLLDGRLVPGTELGDLELDGTPVAELASRQAYEDGGLTVADWAVNVGRFFASLVELVDPVLIVVGGGGGENEHLVSLVREAATVEVRPAVLGNNAGLIGAALMASNL